MEVVDMKRFVPDYIDSGILGNKYPVKIDSYAGKYFITYSHPISNQTGPNVGIKTHKRILPAKLILDTQCFEVIGLLQGEMSKTTRRGLTFCNSRPELMNPVLIWFAKQMDFPSNQWSWYIKLNINQPKNDELTYVLSDELSAYWVMNTSIDPLKSYPKRVSFISKTKNEIAKNNGSLIIEKRNPIFVQTIHKLVNTITFMMPLRSKAEIIAYMRGIIAAESTVNFNFLTGHYRIFITATKEDERKIFWQCLTKLGIAFKDCKPLKDIVISRKQNIRKLHKLGLMTLNKEKHEVFLRMIDHYRVF